MLRIGLVGCGVITQRTLNGIVAILAERQAAVTALCDPNAENLEMVKDRLPGSSDVSRSDSLGALIAEHRCDAVLLATPIGMHFAQVKTALENGLHVYTHKTLARTRSECEELDELAKSAGLRLAASPGQVLLPAYRRAAELLRGGELGAVVSVDAAAEAAPHRYEAERIDESPPEDGSFSWEWYHRQELGGGPLDDMFVYPLAFLTEVFGDLVDAHVVGQLVTPKIEWQGRLVEATAADSYCGVIRFRDAVATIRSSFSSNTQHIPWGTIVARGTDAALELIKHDDLNYSLFLTTNGGDSVVERHPVYVGEERSRLGDRECHVLADIREFIDAIREERAVQGASAENAARVVGALRSLDAGVTRQ